MGRRIYEGVRNDGVRVMLVERITKPRFVVAMDDNGLIDYQPLGNDREFAIGTYIKAFDLDLREPAEIA